MASTGRQSPEAPEDDTRWRSAGDRIQTLLDASAGSGTVVRERTEQLAAELTDLYGAALERMVSIVAESAPELVGQFAADELVASLMLVHGLHPHGVERRIEDALDSVRPYLGSHGGDVTLLEVADADAGGSAAVRGQLQELPVVGGHPRVRRRRRRPRGRTRDHLDRSRSSGTRRAGVDSSGLISVDSLMSRVHTKDSAGAAWHPVPDIGDLGPGEVGGFLVAGVPILACRIGDELFAYHDRCGRCHESMAGAALHRPMGAPIGQAVLRCPRCQCAFRRRPRRRGHR